MVLNGNEFLKLAIHELRILASCNGKEVSTYVMCYRRCSSKEA